VKATVFTIPNEIEILLQHRLNDLNRQLEKEQEERKRLEEALKK
jgi:hypothetical protein